jgi:hypothetical protein
VSRHSKDGLANIDAQITIMNARAIALLAQAEERWALAGDQLYVDFDLSDDNLPAGTRLAIGSAILEVSGEPHTGCKKFSSRFGVEAMKFVNSPEGKHLHLRGINSRVVRRCGPKSLAGSSLHEPSIYSTIVLYIQRSLQHRTDSKDRLHPVRASGFIFYPI